MTSVDAMTMWDRLSPADQRRLREEVVAQCEELIITHYPDAKERRLAAREMVDFALKPEKAPQKSRAGKRRRNGATKIANRRTLMSKKHDETSYEEYDSPVAETATVTEPPTPTQTAVAEPVPTEIGYTQWEVRPADTDIAFTTPPWTVEVGSTMLIDDEEMTVSDVTNPDNIGVTRTAPVGHAAGAKVMIFGTIPTLVGKTVASVSSFNHGSVLVIDILGTDDKHYLLKVSHQELEIGGSVWWDTGIKA